ncbi:hypothetical protein [Hymenobacter koreensis]|uniref:KilA-N domain-containing protein n=1 Tax=Hymenobacter koreensis TaxID=1084523 RepID=A0ABP8JMY4_9BACT
MKTNVVMLSPDRELFGIKVRQESKTERMSLTDLQSAYEVGRTQYGWSEKRIDHVLNQKENAERIYYLLISQDFIKVDFHTFMETADSKGVVKVLKGLGVYQTKGRGGNKATWCESSIWMLVAMELNPMLYAKTVLWLRDQLLVNRVVAGNNYKMFSEALKSIGVSDFSKFAQALNWVVFGSHQNGMRNLATAEQLKQLADLEDKMAFSIRMGFIQSEDNALNALRKMWFQRPGNPFQSAA